jgi:hypothetical protein
MPSHELFDVTDLIMYASISFELNSWAAAAGTIFGIYWRPAIAQLEIMRGYYQG